MWKKIKSFFSKKEPIYIDDSEKAKQLAIDSDEELWGLMENSKGDLKYVFGEEYDGSSTGGSSTDVEKD